MEKKNALGGTKFTAFKAKLASCEATSIKVEASKAQTTNKTSAFCGTNVASGEASTLDGNKFKAFYRAKITFGNAKITLCKVKTKDSGEASLTLSRAKATAFLRG